jgi:Ca2+-binding RTX toxin-like protein
MAGDDSLNSGLGDDKADGGEGNDFVRGDVVNFGGDALGEGDDLLSGGAGNDLMIGDSVGDTATGGGADRIFGGDAMTV